jgi:FKBP-type peptidyl-prolyl cis-trans isomerase SlpA
MSLEISAGKKISLHFAIRFEDGQEVDSTFGKTPANFVLGDGNMLPGFEEGLVGLKAGDKKEWVITPEKGFGLPNPQNIQEMKRKDFAADMTLEPGLMVSFADANKNELPGTIAEFDDEKVIVDFNHPLAGRNLNFEVEILLVEENSQEAS